MGKDQGRLCDPELPEAGQRQGSSEHTYDCKPLSVFGKALFYIPYYILNSGSGCDFVYIWAAQGMWYLPLQVL